MKKIGIIALVPVLFLAACTTTSEGSTEALRAPFADNRSQIDGCYTKVMKKQPDIGEGTVEMKFLIDDEGKAKKTIFMKKRSSLHNKMLNACIKKVVHSWSFPASGKDLEVVYPFTFERSSASLSPSHQSMAAPAKAKPSPQPWKASPNPKETRSRRH